MLLLLRARRGGVIIFKSKKSKYSIKNLTDRIFSSFHGTKTKTKNKKLRHSFVRDLHIKTPRKKMLKKSRRLESIKKKEEEDDGRIFIEYSARRRCRAISNSKRPIQGSING